MGPLYTFPRTSVSPEQKAQGQQLRNAFRVINDSVSSINTNSSVEEVSQPIAFNEETNLPETNLIELAQPVDELPPLPDEIEGYKTVSFDKLASFAYEVPLDPVTNKVELAKLNSQIPEVIKKFDKRPIATV